MHSFDLSFEVVGVPAKDPRFQKGAILTFSEAVEFFEMDAAIHLARVSCASFWSCDGYTMAVHNKRRQAL